jgi:hypothetical protein
MSPSARPKTDRKPKAAAPSVGPDPVKDSTRVSETDIAQKAFSYYCERGYQDGSDVEDWLRAERELRGTPPPAPAGRRRRQASA